MSASAPNVPDPDPSSLTVTVEDVYGGKTWAELEATLAKWIMPHRLVRFVRRRELVREPGQIVLSPDSFPYSSGAAYCTGVPMNHAAYLVVEPLKRKRKEIVFTQSDETRSLRRGDWFMGSAGEMLLCYCDVAAAVHDIYRREEREVEE